MSTLKGPNVHTFVVELDVSSGWDAKELVRQGINRVCCYITHRLHVEEVPTRVLTPESIAEAFESPADFAVGPNKRFQIITLEDIEAWLGGHGKDYLPSTTGWYRWIVPWLEWLVRQLKTAEEQLGKEEQAAEEAEAKLAKLQEEDYNCKAWMDSLRRKLAESETGHALAKMDIDTLRTLLRKAEERADVAEKKIDKARAASFDAGFMRGKMEMESRATAAESLIGEMCIGGMWESLKSWTERQPKPWLDVAEADGSFFTNTATDRMSQQPDPGKCMCSECFAQGVSEVHGHSGPHRRR